MKLCHDCCIAVVNADTSHIEEPSALERILDSMQRLGRIVVDVDEVVHQWYRCELCGEEHTSGYRVVDY